MESNTEKKKENIHISRNASKKLKKQYEDYIAQYPGQWKISDWYGQGFANDVPIPANLPVIIKE